MTPDLIFLIWVAFVCFVVTVALVGIVFEIRSEAGGRDQEVADAYRRGWRDGREGRSTGATQRPFDWSKD